MRLVLDISRTVARARLPAPTGIDRVERAHIERALGRDALFLCRLGDAQHLVEADAVARLLGWLDGDGPPPVRNLWALNPLRDGRRARAEALIRRGSTGRAAAGDAGAIATMLRRAGAGGVYLNTGHDNLSHAVIDGGGAAGLARLVMIHDLIPLDQPQFARPQTPERFRAKLAAALRADVILCNSADTVARLRAHVPGTMPRLVTAPLGIDPPGPVVPDPLGGFVCLGTIEPRKNHALLLDLWARLWQRQGESAPRLHLVGRRGWMNEEVFRRLDTAPMIGRTVFEHGALPDQRARSLLAGARALLFPSFAEGFGLPLAEALALGVPVIASDLPALREVGGAVPEWLSPHDPTGWEGALLAHAADPSPRREAQLQRLRDWRAPRWEDHFRIVDNATETILAQSAGGR